MIREIVLHHRTFADLSKNDNITENGIYTYLCLKPFAVSSNWTYLYTDAVKLNSVLSDVDINNKRQKDCIRTGLKELEEADLIKIISNKNYDYKLDLEGMIEPYDKKNPNPYTVYEADAFKQALKDCGNKKTILKQLSDFFYRLTHLGGSEMFYFTSERESIAESCGIDVRSVDKYNDILVKNKLIYIHKYDYKYFDSKKQLRNVYGLYKNKDKIDNYCNEYLNSVKDDVYLSPIPRGKGSIKQKKTKKPIESVTTEEFHVKRMKKTIAPIQKVEETVQADDNEVAEKNDFYVCKRLRLCHFLLSNRAGILGNLFPR